MLVVASFYVDRRADYPEAVDYLPLLNILDRSCRAIGVEHVILTDHLTADDLLVAGLVPVVMNLPRNLTRAFTEAQALWLEGGGDDDTLFTGADCLIRRDFRGHIPAGDLAIAFRPDGKRHRLQNGFMYVRAESRAKVAPLFRSIADSCGEAMCDDLVAVERALAPMPATYGLQERAGLTVNFVPMSPWNDAPDAPEDPSRDAMVLHFRGRRRKQLMLDWAARWMPA